MEKKVVRKIIREVETMLGLYLIEVYLYDDGTVEVRD